MYVDTTTWISYELHFNDKALWWEKYISNENENK
jgi:hypothetical protein